MQWKEVSLEGMMGALRLRADRAPTVESSLETARESAQGRGRSENDCPSAGVISP